jgi:hypothetical protein
MKIHPVTLQIKDQLACKSLKVLIVLSLHSKTHNPFRSRSPSLYHLTYTEGNSNDPYGELDYIHQLRTDVGADMVALITTGAGKWRLSFDRFSF